MAPNKLENQIKEKLNSREIQPSAQAWDRLDAMLTVAEEKKTKRSFGWKYIAASITVLLTAGMFFFTQKSSEIQPKNNVVGTEVKEDSVQESVKNVHKLAVQEQHENKIIATSENKSRSNSHIQSTRNQEEVLIINQKTPNNKNQIIKDKEIKFEYSSDIALKDLPKIQTGNQIIIEGNKNYKSDEDLLADLDKAGKQSSNQKSSIKVDAKCLLSQVDGEVEFTFREKVLNKINKNYKEVKVALSNRNNE